MLPCSPCSMARQALRMEGLLQHKPMVQGQHRIWFVPEGELQAAASIVQAAVAAGALPAAAAGAAPAAPAPQPLVAGVLGRGAQGAAAAGGGPSPARQRQAEEEQPGGGAGAGEAAGAAARLDALHWPLPVPPSFLAKQHAAKCVGEVRRWQAGILHVLQVGVSSILAPLWVQVDLQTLARQPTPALSNSSPTCCRPATAGPSPPVSLRLARRAPSPSQAPTSPMAATCTGDRVAHQLPCSCQLVPCAMVCWSASVLATGSLPSELSLVRSVGRNLLRDDVGLVRSSSPQGQGGALVWSLTAGGAATRAVARLLQGAQAAGDLPQAAPGAAAAAAAAAAGDSLDDDSDFAEQPAVQQQPGGGARPGQAAGAATGLDGLLWHNLLPPSLLAKASASELKRWTAGILQELQVGVLGSLGCCAGWLVCAAAPSGSLLMSCRPASAHPSCPPRLRLAPHAPSAGQCRT